jgi:hypothetical protein
MNSQTRADDVFDKAAAGAVLAAGVVLLAFVYRLTIVAAPLLKSMVAARTALGY